MFLSTLKLHLPFTSNIFILMFISFLLLYELLIMKTQPLLLVLLSCHHIILYIWYIEKTGSSGDYVSLHSVGRPWSSWSPQSGCVPSSGHESYSSIYRKIHTSTLQVSDIRIYIGKNNYPITVQSLRDRNNRVLHSRY